MREDCYDLFSVFQPDLQYHWNEIFHRGFDAFAAEIARLLPNGDLVQENRGRQVIWRNRAGRIEVMFAFIIDPTDLDAIVDTFADIRREGIPLTFAIIEQRGDGPRNYDIFRLSERSYLEHTNRAWPRGTSPDPL